MEWIGKEEIFMPWNYCLFWSEELEAVSDVQTVAEWNVETSKFPE